MITNDKVLRMPVVFCCICLVFMWGGITGTAFAASDAQAVSKPAEQPLNVVTTFSILADMVSQLGGERVRVDTLVDWDEDAHVFQPTPDDVKRVAKADLLILNGLGFEGWLSRLLTAANYQGVVVEATRGVDLIRMNLRAEAVPYYKHSAVSVYDPHAWHSVQAALHYIENIAGALIKLDPAHTAYYRQRHRAYIGQLEALNERIRSALNRIPEANRRLVVPHNAFAYLARDYHLHIHSLQGMSTDSEVSAADMVHLVRLIKGLGVKAIFTEANADKRLIRVIEAETDAHIEGVLISGALSRQLAPTYLDMMQYNLEKILQGLNK